MVFFKRRDVGRIYIIKMVLPDGCIVHKIGMTHSNRATDRMMEILRSWFTRYRFVPYSELRLDMECNYPGDLEKHIHRILKSKRFEPDEKVEGGTEMFTEINEVRVIHYLRNFDEASVDSLTSLTDTDCSNICKLLTGKR